MEKKHPLDNHSEEGQNDFTEMISHIMFDDLVSPKKTKKPEPKTPKQTENK